MQPVNLRSKLLRDHYVRSLEGTNNLLFFFASLAPIQDKNRKLPPELIGALNLPSEIKSMYDYRCRYNGIYDRLYQLCIISLCSDIEYMFKELFLNRNIIKKPDRGFFQRFAEVIKVLEDKDFDFTAIDQDLKNLRLAFSIRHISIHNLGYIDKDFINQTESSATVGDYFVLDEDDFKMMFRSYYSFIECLDCQIVP